MIAHLLQIPETGVEGFLTDFTMANDDHAVVNSQTTKMCDLCDSGDPAVSCCSDCSTNLCDFCSQAHRRQKQYRSHKTVAIIGAQSAKNLHEEAFHCGAHATESLIVFCKNCQCLICHSCIVDAHNGHCFAPIDHTTREEVETQVKDLAESAKQTLVKFQNYLDYTADVEKRKLNAPSGLREEINLVFESLVDAIKARRQELLSQVKDESKEVWSEKDRIETVISALKCTLSFAERSLECRDDSQFLVLCPQFMPRLGELKAAKWDSTPIETIDITEQVFQFSGLHAQISRYGSVVNKTSGAPAQGPKLGGQGLFSTPLTGLGVSGSTSGLYKPYPPLNLSIKSHSNPELGEDVSVKLSVRLRPSMYQATTVRVTKNLTTQQQWSGLKPGSTALRSQIRYESVTVSKMTYSITQFNEISVHFIPLVSGEHQISVTSGNQAEHVEINIVGKPKIGARVKPGPHWNQQGFGQQHYYGGTYTQGLNLGSGNRSVHGTVLSNHEDGCVSVLWEHNSQPQVHAWGKNGQYSVQLDM